MIYISVYIEKEITFHQVGEIGCDTERFGNYWVKIRLGDEVIGKGDTLIEAVNSCELTKDWH